MIHFTYDIPQLADYLGVSKKKILEEMPLVGAVTLAGLYQYPVLTPESPRMGGKSLFSKLKSLKRLPNVYYGIGGDIQPYRTLLGFMGMRRYANTLKSLTDGMQPRIVLYDASLYDLVNKIDGESKSEIAKNVSANYNELSSRLNVCDPKGWRTADTLLEYSKEFFSRFPNLVDKETLARMERRKQVFLNMAEVSGLDFLTVKSSYELISSQEFRSIVTKFIQDKRDAYVEKENKLIAMWTQLVPLSYRDNLFSWLYIPMEIAEAIILKQRQGTRIKFGDLNEKGFDNLISREASDYIFAYTEPAITDNGDRPCYRNKDDINFDMTKDEARRRLESYPFYVTAQFQKILKELGRNTSDTVEGTLSAFSEIKGE